MTDSTPVLPALTATQMREVDRIMTDDLRIDLVQMMENAGRNLADLVGRLYGPSDVVVLAGPGGNGGGGLVAASHLANRGVRVRIVLAQGDSRPAPCQRTEATMTLALPKRGLIGSPQAGRLYLADISVPPQVYARMGLQVGYLFANGSLVELDERGQPMGRRWTSG